MSNTGIIVLIIFVLQVSFFEHVQTLGTNGNRVISNNESYDQISALEYNQNAVGTKNKKNAEHIIIGRDLLDAPKTYILINVIGSEELPHQNYSFDFTDDFEAQKLLDVLKSQFGNEMVHARLNSSGIFTSVVKRNSAMNIDQRQEEQAVKNMEKLVEAIHESDRKINSGVDYYRIHLDLSNARTSEEKRELQEDIKKRIKILAEAVRKDVKKDPYQNAIFPTQPTKENENKPLNDFRRNHNVSRAQVLDQSTLFVIGMLVTFCFILAVVSMLWFMLDESDMGKNSLVYRLTTTRQKMD